MNKKQVFDPNKKQGFKSIIEMKKKYKLILIKTLYWVSIAIVSYIASLFLLLYLIAYYVDID